MESAGHQLAYHPIQVLGVNRAGGNKDTGHATGDRASRIQARLDGGNATSSQLPFGGVAQNGDHTITQFGLTLDEIDQHPGFVVGTEDTHRAAEQAPYPAGA